jgi:hypothetical protein
MIGLAARVGEMLMSELQQLVGLILLEQKQRREVIDTGVWRHQPRVGLDASARMIKKVKRKSQRLHPLVLGRNDPSARASS